MVLWGLAKKRKKPRTGRTALTGPTAPTGPTGAVRRRPAPTAAGGESRHANAPHTPKVDDTQPSAMSGGLVGCCEKHGCAQIRRELRAETPVHAAGGDGAADGSYMSPSSSSSTAHQT